MAGATEPLDALSARWPRWVGELADFVAIPSVSSDPRRRGDIQRAADWLRARLRALGMSRASLVQTPGNPVVWAEWTTPGAASRVLMYGHYDVVTPGGRTEWHSPPFLPVARGGFLYGRGASDDKGPVVAQLAALDAWLSTRGRLPVNVTCLFEGEEEIGSPHLRALLRHRRPVARGPVFDAAVISDTRMLGPGLPTLVTGLRGSLAAELEVRGPRRDVHSGAFGGAIRNPAHVLAELIASLHDGAGRVSIAGFYRDVRPPGRDRFEGQPVARIITAQLLAQGGPRIAFGEPGFSTYERTAQRPALDVNGIEAGHTGPGAKGVIPARATAKLSFRLVPDQDPRRVAVLLRRHLARRLPRGVRLRTSFSKPVLPVTIDPFTPAAHAARAALEAGFGRAPALLDSGGTIPVVESFATRVGTPVLMGFARPDDGMHGPDERVDLSALAAGSRSLVHFLALMSKPAVHGVTSRSLTPPRVGAIA